MISIGNYFGHYLLVGGIYVVLAYGWDLGDVLEDFKASSEYRDVCAMMGEGFTNTICAVGLVFMFIWTALFWPYYLAVDGV